MKSNQGSFSYLQEEYHCAWLTVADINQDTNPAEKYSSGYFLLEWAAAVL